MQLPSSLRKSLFLPVLAVVLTFVAAPFAHAGAPVLDNGNQPNLNNFYANVQNTTADVFTNHAIYGKLDGTTPIDVYSFTPSKTGTVQLSLYVRKDEVVSSTNPYLILVDPTSNTESQDLGVPLPNNNYHATVVTQVDLTNPRTYTEPVLMETYDVAAQQSIKLAAGQKYYVIVLDSDSTGHHITHYAIGFGVGNAWTASDFFKSFGSWVRLRLDTYAGSGPFKFPAVAVSYFFLLLGLAIFGGAWILYHFFNLFSTRSKTIAYLFVKLQKYVPIQLWVGLWFLALGGYLYDARGSWAGIPFASVFIFLALLVVTLIDTIRLSSQVKQVEMKRQEASIPLQLRKKLFICFVFELIFFVTFLVFLAMQVA